MDRFAAHYIFTGNAVLRKAVLAQNELNEIVSLSTQDAMAIEYSNTIFFNGIICPEFCPVAQPLSAGFTPVHLHAPVPDLKVNPDQLVISFNKGEENLLFAFFSALQMQHGYTVFELLAAVCANNYQAQNKVPPAIEVGQKLRLILLKGLNLVEGTFRKNTSLRYLSR